MGECIGFDFGTTYSAVVRLAEGGGDTLPVLQAVDFGNSSHGATSMETLVVKTKDDYTYIGNEAVRPMRSKDAAAFRGFKMLLNRPAGDPELKRRGYIGDNRPENITALYISELFKKARKLHPEYQDIDKVVVGVPYVWTENGEDSRKYQVVEIVKRVTGASMVEFRSEPTLACAYYVQEINRQRAELFEGHILVIDYGGGTLDVTLCKAENLDGTSHISVCNSWGAGENTEGRVGSAGLAFMEEVADSLLAEDYAGADLEKDKEYQSFVKEIEAAIKDASSHLEGCYEKAARYFTSGGPRYEHEIPGVFALYKYKEYNVRYSTLVKAYDKIIRPVLAEVLNNATAYMAESNISYDDDNGGSFKIVTVGGFCNFILTQKQIRDDTDSLKDHSKGMDTRYTELDKIIGLKSRELAIAYGAALNANNIVEIKKQFPYTLCFYTEKDSTSQQKAPNRKAQKRSVQRHSEQTVGKKNLGKEFIIFRENEEFEPGKPVFFGCEETDESGERILRKLPVRGERIPFIGRKKNGKSSRIERPGKEMKLPGGGTGALYIAIAMEQNENLTLYAYNQQIFDNLPREEQENPRNRALIGEPSAFQSIDVLLGTLVEK